MVRTIDGDARRRVLAEAVWRLLEREGPDGASVRGVAAEAGLSTGSVRHFFATQDELHRFAMAELSARVQQRVRTAAAEPDVRARVVAMIGELMPLRDDTAAELGVWFAFVQRSRHDAALAALVSTQAAEVRAFLRVVVDDLRALGHLPEHTDVDAATTTLNALVDGLTFQLLSAPDLLSREEAAHTVERHLFGDHDPRGGRP